MNSLHKRWLNVLVMGLTVFSLVFNLALPLASFVSTVSAQEATEEPTLPAAPEETPTDAPPPTSEATVEPTGEPTTAPTAEVTPVVTDDPTPTPTQPPTSFSDDFQDGSADGWLLTPGWAIVNDNNNLFLTAAEPGQAATITSFVVADFALSARLRLDSGKTASVAVRSGAESYAVSLDASGTAALYRGPTLLAQGAVLPPLPEDAPALWHTLYLQVYGGLIVITVNGTPQIVYTDVNPLPPGLVVFGTATGGFSLDEVAVSALTAPITPPVIPPPPVPTAEVTPELTPEATPEPEVTPELTPEATLEAEVTPESTPEQTPEATPELTPEATPEPELLVLSADFEGDMADWTFTETAGVVADGETNHALLMAAGSSLLPTNPPYLTDFRLEARLNIIEAADGAPSGISIPFRTSDGSSYVLSVEAAQTVLYRNDGAGLNALATVPAAHAVNTWHALALTARGGQITAAVNGTLELDFTDPAPLAGGQLAFAANGTAMVDDIAVYVPVLLTAAVTPAPMGLTDNERGKLAPALVSIVERYSAGDTAGAVQQANDSFLMLDEQMRLKVEVWANEGQTGAAVAPIVEAVGGEIGFVHDYHVEALVPLAGFIALVNTDTIIQIRPAAQATSTGTADAPAAAPSGEAVTEGFDILGVNDWHEAGITGKIGNSRVKIAVIDTGFAGITSVSAAELPTTCLPSRTVTGGVGTTDHGTRVAEVLCDIAPDAAMTLYRATTASELASRISAARDANFPIILITMDAGVVASPGDGDEGLDASGTMYDHITAARNEGRLVIVSAGNNTGRYASFNYTSGNTTVNITADAGDQVNVSWDDWNIVAPKVELNMTLAMTNTPNQTFTFGDRPTNGPPSHQFTVSSGCGTSCTGTLTFSGITAGVSSAYVQVQITGSGMLNSVTGATGVNLTSTIGRPADSPNALTVGAVCSFPVEGFPVEMHSSQGPIFSDGGGAPLTGPFTSRAAFKPDIASIAGVTTSQGERFDACNLDDPADAGFNGTSAAAAHIAGLAALIRSNPNDNINPSPANAATIINYLQSHAVDLYDATSAEANGFDMRTGAGLAVLGNPQPDYPLISTETEPLPAAPTCPGGFVYVDPNNSDADFASDYGSFANPFVHPAHALAANTTGSGDCVILMPGEYVTPVNILEGSVNDGVGLRAYKALKPAGDPDAPVTTGDSVFWVNLPGYDNMSRGGGGLFISADTITVDGFVFLGATRHGALAVFNEFAGIFLGNSAGSFVRNNLFTRFISGPPVLVGTLDGGSQGVVIENNTFRDNNTEFGAGISIGGSSGTSTPITVQFNTFTANNGASGSQGIFAPIINISSGTANIYNNRFVNNATQSIIRVTNLADSFLVTVFGNTFANNTNTGPVVHLNPGRRFRFINNTVAGHKSIGGFDGSAIIMRGQTDTSPTNGSGQWDIFNNLFYDNTVNSPLADADIGSATCHRIGVTSGTEQGAQYNWIIQSGNPTGSGFGGICVNPVEDPNLHNNLHVGSTPADFEVVGPDIAPDDPYQLISGPASSQNDGIDDGSNALAAGLPNRDVLNRNRIENGTIDIGAYEYRVISAQDLTPAGVEDATDPVSGKPLPITFTLRADGGFPPYTFSINEYPTIYDTNPANRCGGQPLLLNGNQVTYCPPRNLYTVGAPAASQVSFTYHVTDRAGNSTVNNDSPGTVTIQITPTPDPVLAQSITQNVTVESAAPAAAFTPVEFRLRPYVSFDDNFFFSEDGENEDVANGSLWNQTPGADYPYTYSYVPGSLSPANAGALNISEAAIQNAIANANADDDSLIALQAEAGEKGTFSFRYTVNGGTVQHTVTIEVVSALPYGGLHDDTSFSFNYDANWSPIYSEGNINNTLHRSLKTGATASFKFVGTGFALYMQGSTRGNYWELQVDGQPFTWNGSKITTRGNITCRTTAVTGTGVNANRIYNRLANAYTVSCTRLRQGEAHEISIINRANAQLDVDAVGILVENAILLPGFHEVRETQMVPLFFGWNDITDRGSSNGIAMATTDAGVAPVTFTFEGTGFAIGTTLERTRTSPQQGAKYSICVAPADTGTPQVCQDFDNAFSAGRSPVWNVFRPFYGFDPTIEHEVTLEITEIPAGTRMVIDSIVIFNQQIANVLPLGTTEDTNRADIVLGSGVEDTWVLDTNNSRTSGNSLSSINSRVTKAGPFISFQIPDDATSFSWLRYPSSADSTAILVCVDRAQLSPADTQTTFCVEKPLRTVVGRTVTTHNPLVITESDFGEDGWGVPGTNGAHTVEIFSLTNQTFNLDRLQVLSSTAPLQPSTYEQTVPNLTYFDDPSVNGLSVTTVNNTRASGGSVAFIRESGEGVFFRFTGTGFSALFTLDRYGGPVQLCWLKDTAQTATVNDVINNGVCNVFPFNNYNRTTVYQAARTIAGLEDTTYAAVIQHVGATYTVNGRVITGNSMQVDAVRIYGDRWQDLNELMPLPNGGRYETSFVNQAADNRFNYLGGVWKSVSGTAARNYSGQNYDQVRAFGAGIVFRTNGADTVRLYHDIRAGYAPLRLCYAPYTAGTFIVDYDLLNCVDIRNDGGTAYQSAYNVYLGGNGAYVVSITTLNAGVFNLDAIELANAAPLQPGIHNETTPGIIYYSTTDPNLNDTANDWRNIALRSYADGAAMQSTMPGASMYFEFEGTGFSLLTLLDSTSSDLEIEVNKLPDPPEASYTVNMTGFSSRVYYGNAHSVTGLPYDTYKVLITATARSKFTVDGIEIYGAQAAALTPGIYDDSADDASGQPLFQYGPNNGTWTVNLGSRARANLNQSSHTSSRQGATLSFAVTGANAITLHHIGSTSTNVLFCARRTDAPFTETCLPATTTLAGSNNTTFTLGDVGNYQVSITNLAPAKTLIVDAIGVLNTTGTQPTMRPGIYQENSSLLQYAGSWTPAPLTEASATDKRVRGTAAGGSSQTLSFTFNGTGFSIILVESTTTSSNYSLAVDGTAVTLPTPNANTAISSARALSALTYVGFAPGAYNVVLTNLDTNNRPLLVDRVDVLGDVSAIAPEVTGGVENTDPRIVYFPYFSFIETAAAAASGGSQHIGSMRGSVVYFEVNQAAFDYVRETKSSYGSVAVCHAGATTPDLDCATTPAATIANNTAPFGFQKSENAEAISGKWVILRNTDGRMMPLDFVRPTNTSDTLTAGYYEDTLAGTYNSFAFDGSFTETISASASGGTVQTTTTQNGAALFQFSGTGFSVYFTLDKLADTIDICWKPAPLTTNAADVERGDSGVICQGQTAPSYDNTSAATRYKAARTILDLPDGSYTVVVRHTGAAGTTSMQVDAIQIYDDAQPANLLDDVGTRYETSFTNRAVDGLFLYYGQGWRSVSGRSAARYSGQNYDTIANVIGAGLLFRTDNADSITLYRAVGSAVPAVEVCAQRLDDGSRTCTTVTSKTGSGNQPTVAIPLNTAEYDGEHVVSIVTLEAGTFTLDAVEIASSSAPLQPGLYEDVSPGLKFANGVWTNVFSSRHSDGRARWTSDDQATLEFSFEDATGFEVSAVADVYGGEMQICYRANNNNWADAANNRCYTYQNESARASYTTSRTVTGLSDTLTYYVRVTNDDDPNLPKPRNPRYAPARLVVDYVRIFGEALPPAITESVQYNEDAANSGGEKYLQLLPTNRWNTFTGTAARGFSGGSYIGVVADNRRSSNSYAGPAATLHLNNASAATVILYTGPASSANPAEMLVCANNVTTADCTIIKNLKTANQIVLNSANLPVLANAANVTLSFRALVPGQFRIDGYQVIYGTTLTPGIYDSFLISNGGLLNTDGSTWTEMKSSRAYGGWLSRTQTPDAAFTFNFDGAGFSVLTQADRYGADMRLCYEVEGNPAPFPPIETVIPPEGYVQNGVTCVLMTTDTAASSGEATWLTLNGDRPKPATAYQYGFAVHGLPAGAYTAEVRHVDKSSVLSRGVRIDWLQVDAVVVFGAPGAALASGQIYDDRHPDIVYSPSAFWTLLTARYGPMRGPWERTDHNTTTVGAPAQIEVDGNALVLYQTASTRGSRKVRLCVTMDEGQECTDFSQSARTTYFTPVAFYGLGRSDTHQIVIENWDYGKTLSIDALQVLP